MSGTIDPTLFADVASAFNPALAGYADVANVAPSLASGIDASIDPGWGSVTPSGGGIFGSGVSGTDLAKALKDLQGGLNQQQQQSAGGQQRAVQAQAGSAQSGTGQGSSAGINALINMLLQRSNQYFPGQPNPKPVALGRPSGGGLLGL